MVLPAVSRLPKGMSPIFLGALVLLGLAILLHIIGLSSPEWSVAHKNETKMNENSNEDRKRRSPIINFPDFTGDSSESDTTESNEDDINLGRTHNDVFIPTKSRGLWKVCFDGSCTKYEKKEQTSALRASGACAILGLVTGLAAMTSAILHVALDRTDTTFILVGVGASFAMFLWVLMGVVIWGAKVHDHWHQKFGYSFGFSIVGMIFGLGAGILMVVGSNKCLHQLFGGKEPSSGTTVAISTTTNNQQMMRA